MFAIDSRTRLFGLFGHPVGHSLSPDMHNAALQALGVNGVYLAFDIPPEGLGQALKAVRTLGIAGVNLTIPHKEAALDLLDEVTPAARLIGAVNTVVQQGGRLIGHNTDGEGFLRSLLEGAGEDPADREILILGAGGAARAVAVILGLRGTKKLWIANRHRQRGEELAAAVSQGTGAEAEAIDLDRAALQAVVGRTPIIIHTTSVGMAPNTKADPLIDPRLLGPEHLVCDLIYNPGETRLLKEAKDRGARTLNGLGMLLYQGVLALELWLGQKAPVTLMEQALEAGLRRRQTT